ncbi:MAG: hypothetical protein ACI4AH_04675 [Muribaculaceae bacterium]
MAVKVMYFLEITTKNREKHFSLCRKSEFRNEIVTKTSQYAPKFAEITKNVAAAMVFECHEMSMSKILRKFVGF